MSCYGWNGKRLYIDLSTGIVEKQTIEPEELHAYLGGRGLNVYMLAKHLPLNTDPLAPENVLCFGAGPLTGTNVPSNGRYNATAKSPATGILGDANSGGFWGPELRYAGYDQLVLTGYSEKPVYLLIRDDTIEIRDAGQLWGKSVWETEEIIKTELNDQSLQIASIGPAGENMVLYASIMNNLSRAAGRTGMGAVMGSKNLKAIVIRGSKGIRIARPDRLSEINAKLLEAMYAAASYPMRSTLGTSMLVELYHGMGILPTRNTKDSVFEGSDAISGRTLANRYVRKPKACFACPVHCSHFYEVKEGNFAGTYGEGPEFESMVAVGSRCGNADLASILHANNLCNQYGLDTISTGGVISFLMECHEAGLVSPQEIDGLDLNWGNSETIIKLIHKIGRREGVGELLAEGVAGTAKAIPGSEEFVQVVKGLEVPSQDVRGLKSWALGWAVSSRGCDHCRAFPLAETTWSPSEAKRVFGTEKAADRFATDGKAEMVKWYEEVNAVGDSLELCKIAQLGCNMPLGLVAQALSAVTGSEFTEDQLLECGERIVNLERLFNLREGLTPADDNLPKRYLEEPVTDGPSEGEIVDLKPMLQRYYQLRSWDEESGYPAPALLKRLGLEGFSGK